MKYSVERGRTGTMPQRVSLLFIMMVAGVLLVSCLGVDVAVSFGKDGTGTITQTYTLSPELAGFGSSAYDTPQLALPLTKAEIEAGLNGFGNLRLTSYTRKDSSKNTVITFSISFDSPDALAAYLDAGSSMVRYAREGDMHRISFAAGSAIPLLDSRTIEEAKTGLEGYAFRLAVSAPVQATASVEGAGSITVRNNGNRAEISAAMKDILLSPTPMSASIIWK